MVIPELDPAALPLLLWAAVAFVGCVLLLREVQALFTLLHRVGRLRWWPPLALVLLAASLWSLALALGAAEAWSNIQPLPCAPYALPRACAAVLHFWSLRYPQALAEKLTTFDTLGGITLVSLALIVLATELGIRRWLRGLPPASQERAWKVAERQKGKQPKQGQPWPKREQMRFWA